MNKFLLVFIMLLVFTILFAQDSNWNQYTHCGSISNQRFEDDYNWIIYDFTNSPLPNEQIRSIKLDIDNSIWLVYLHSLIRFNGETWEIYNHNNFGYSSHLIGNFDIDEDGNKWFALYDTNYNSILIKFDNINWTAISYNFENSLMRYIITDLENNKWFAASQCIGFDWFGNPIFHHRLANYDGNIWNVYDNTNSLYPSNANHSCSLLDGSDIIWFGSDRGLLRFDGSEFIIYNTDNSALPENDVRNLLIDNSELLWIGTRTSGMASFNGVEWEIFSSENSNYPAGWLRSMKKDIYGNLWIAVSSKLSKFDGTNFEAIAVSNSGLTTNNLTSLAIESDGTKWIGTWYSNLHSFNGNEWICYTTENSGLPYHNIKCIEIDENGNKWIGTSWGLAILNDDEWTVYNTNNSGLPTNDINEIAFGLNGIVWIGTDNEGLVKYDGENWTIYNTDNSNLPHNIIQSLTIHNDLLWIGTRENLASFDGENWVIYDLELLGFDFDSVTDIAIEENGSKWVAVPAEGLIHYDGNNWVLFDSDNSDLPSNWIREITIDESNVKWIGTNSGLAKFDDDSWSVFTIYNSGLSNNDIVTICIDENNSKWIATDGGGLSVFNENGIPVSIKSYELINISDNFLLHNYPNPFNPSTTFSFSINERSKVNLSIYNVKGQKIKTILDNEISSGNHSYLWFGDNRNNNSVSSGVYIYKLKVNNETNVIKRCILLK